MPSHTLRRTATRASWSHRAWSAMSREWGVDTRASLCPSRAAVHHPLLRLRLRCAALRRYWLNKLLAGSSPAWACINAAVEEGTIGERTGTGLLDQDAWIRDNMQDGDVLIVSVGGNDIALRPSVSTMASMASVLALGTDAGIESCSAMGMGHFVHMFKDGVQDYVGKLVSKATPAFAAVCMIYYPHEAPAGGWADGLLARLGYNSNPRRLQLMIRSVYAKATCAVALPRGIPVVPVALFSILDPSPTSTD